MYAPDAMLGRLTPAARRLRRNARMVALGSISLVASDLWNRRREGLDNRLVGAGVGRLFVGAFPNRVPLKANNAPVRLNPFDCDVDLRVDDLRRMPASLFRWK